MSIQWKREPVPAKKQRTSNMWERLIPSGLIREMRMNPGTTYQLLDPHGKPLVLHARAIAAMQRATSRSFRIQTRHAEGRDDKGRHVWVSFDPGHWERHEKGTRK